MDSSKEKVPAASIVGDNAGEESRDMSKLQRTSSNPLIRAEKAVERRLTVLWHEIEQWQQDNAFIISGYRPTSNSYFKSWASLGYLHNESVNIYTHLIGAIVSIIAFGITYYILQGRYDVANHEDIVVFSCFFLGAAVCLGMSATYHTISNHSSTVARFGNKLDYFGIVFLIWGSFIPSLYYGFAGDAPNFHFFSVVITTIGAATAAVTLLPFFSGTAWRPFRAFMFMTMGLSALWPVVYGVNEYGWQKLWQQMALPWLFAQGALYILGASIYVALIPERFNPGTFDIWGSSHQIFHVFVLIAAATHFIGLVKAFDRHHSLRLKPGYMEYFALQFLRMQSTAYAS